MRLITKRSCHKIGIFLIAVTATGCNDLNSLQSRVENVVNELFVKKESTQPTPNSNEPIDNRQINGEFIKEVFQVVMERDVRNEQEFMKYMNILDQGAHYEGIYNGLIYSEEYRSHESGIETKMSPVAAIKAYTKLMAELMLNQKFDPIQIKKRAANESEEAVLPGTAATPPPQPTDADRTAAAAEAEKEALTASLFFLKRRLGEEVLKTISLKRVYREKLATWYGHFAVLTNGFGVEFGLAERGRADEYYHYKWALEADEDRLKWEALNRVHRILNSKARP